MATNRYNKDPADVLDYQFDWSGLLGADTIQSSTWVVPTGLTQVTATATATAATVWLSGGTAGESYDVTNRIVTAGGRTVERSIVVRVVNL